MEYEINNAFEIIMENPRACILGDTERICFFVYVWIGKKEC